MEVRQGVSPSGWPRVGKVGLGWAGLGWATKKEPKSP